MEARRELPPAIRGFVKKSGELGRTAIGVGVLQGFLGLWAYIGAALADSPETAWLCLAIAVIMGAPLGFGIANLARNALKAGYTRGDVLSLWKPAQEREWEERAFEHGRSASRGERIARWSALLGFPVAIGSLVLTDFSASMEMVGWSLYVPSSLAWIIGGGISLWRYDGRKDLGGRLMGKMWRSRVGKWLFSLGGMRLAPSSVAPATHRPTELAIGMAVDALYEALPKPAREQLKALPDTVRELEIQVAKMRVRVEELNDSIATVEPAKMSAGAADKRDALGRDLVEARDAAKARMAQAVSALESIRLDLLRLTAGAGSIEGVTADLAAARDVSQHVRFLIDGDREVAKALRPSTDVPVTR
jgi:hypothetical protein